MLYGNILLTKVKTPFPNDFRQRKGQEKLSLTICNVPVSSNRTQTEDKIKPG